MNRSRKISSSTSVKNFCSYKSTIIARFTFRRIFTASKISHLKPTKILRLSHSRSKFWTRPITTRMARSSPINWARCSPVTFSLRSTSSVSKRTNAMRSYKWTRTSKYRASWTVSTASYIRSKIWRRGKMPFRRIRCKFRTSWITLECSSSSAAEA